MDFSTLQQSAVSGQASSEVQSRVRTYLSKVYMWMAYALMSTALVAGLTAQDPELVYWTMTTTGMVVTIGGSVLTFLIMLLGQRALSASALSILFLTYSALTGLLFGPILIAYTQESLALCFGCTAGTFGAMSLYGTYTKRNLSGVGRFAIMMLLGVIICSVVNIFVGSSMLQFGISLAGVGIFSILTAYDTQRLIAQGGLLEEKHMGKPAIMGALTLYLDFINLFLYLLRFLGDRR